MRRATALFAQIGFLALASPALAGVTVTLQGEKERSVVYLEGNRMRVESEKTGGHQEGLMIFDGDQQKMIILDPAKKTYSEMTPESIKAMSSAMTSRMEEAKAKMTPEQRKQMDEMMAKMSPEQRKQLQGAMGETSAGAEKKPKEPQIKWERTGTKQTVAGFSCEGFKELKDGKPDAEGCYISWSAGAISKGDLAPMRKMEEFLSQSGVNPAQRKLTTFSQLDQMPGFPGVWIQTSSGETKEKQTVTDIKRGSIPTDKFQLPAGYTKRDFASAH